MLRINSDGAGLDNSIQSSIEKCTRLLNKEPSPEERVILTDILTKLKSCKVALNDLRLRDASISATRRNQSQKQELTRETAFSMNQGVCWLRINSAIFELDYNSRTAILLACSMVNLRVYDISQEALTIRNNMFSRNCWGRYGLRQTYNTLNIPLQVNNGKNPAIISDKILMEVITGGSNNPYKPDVYVDIRMAQELVNRNISIIREHNGR